MIDTLTKLLREIQEMNRREDVEKHQELRDEEIVVKGLRDKETNELTIMAYNKETGRTINLTAKRYEHLKEQFSSFGEFIYKKNCIFIKLHSVSKEEEKEKTHCVYGYCRVSSKSQLDNDSLEEQKKEIQSKYFDADIYYEEFKNSGAERSALIEIFSKVSKDDILVATKLDRLARTTKEGIEIIEKLFEREVKVHILSIGLLENSSRGKFFLTTMLAIAEMERSMIVERTQAGKEIAKAKSGYKEGRPKKFESTSIESALSLLNVNGGNMSYTEVEKHTGISKSTLIRAQRKNV